MASYHLDVKTIRRSQGRSATAAAAYRAGERIACDRYGVEHDYTRKGGVLHAEIIAPDNAPEWVSDRSDLWNAAEASEVRKNSVVAREWEVALPHELSDAERRDLALGFARGLVERYGVVADVAIHAPHREGDQRNHHAHIMTSTRRIGPEGFGEKTRELDVKQTSSREVTAMRESWASMQNDALEQAGSGETVDHRSLEAQREEAERHAQEAQERGEREEAVRALMEVEALSRPPEPKLGPRVSAMERRAKREVGLANYVPVTERGMAVVRSREDRSVFEAVRHRIDATRDAYLDARERGSGRADAFAEGLRSLLRREEDRTQGRDAGEPDKKADEGAPRDPVADKLRALLARSEGGGVGRDASDKGEQDRAEVRRREDEQRAAQEAQEQRDRERAKDPRSDAEIEHTRKQIEAIRAKTTREREGRDRDRDDDYDPWDR